MNADDRFHVCNSCVKESCYLRNAAHKPTECWSPCFFWDGGGVLEVREEERELCMPELQADDGHS